MTTADGTVIGGTGVHAVSRPGRAGRRVDPGPDTVHATARNLLAVRVMTRVCAWCNAPQGAGIARAAATDDELSHSMCRLCAIEHFFLGLMARGRAYLRRLAHR